MNGMKVYEFNVETQTEVYRDMTATEYDQWLIDRATITLENDPIEETAEQKLVKLQVEFAALKERLATLETLLKQ